MIGTLSSIHADIQGSGIIEGTYQGVGVHRNGSTFHVSYQVKLVTSTDESNMYCVWISRDDSASLEASLKTQATKPSGEEAEDISDVGCLLMFRLGTNLHSCHLTAPSAGSIL